MIKNLFKLPSPKEMGVSDHNALPMRSFSPWEKGMCWEDFHALQKKEYPIKFFLLKTAPDFIKYKIWFPVYRPVNDGWYWLKCHALPSKKYHLLDLRQPCGEGELANIDCYRYGWSDVPEKMLYAMFNLLKEYMDEKPYNLLTDYSREEIEADIGMKNQQFHYDEAVAILHWWQVERKQEIIQLDKLRTIWSDALQDDTEPDDSETKWHWLQLTYAENEFEKKTDDMIMRLMKIRRGLWT